jgi:drug/metabolite transporter (DMT)-like permease
VPNEGSSRRATSLGLVSILIWSTTVATSRLVMEGFGVFPGAAVVLLAAGLILFSATCLRYRGAGWIRRLSLPHLVRAGPVFVVYMLSMYGAVGLARTRVEGIVGGLANYIWPTLILVFSVLLLRARPRAAPLVLGSALALVGIGIGASANAGGIAQLAAALRNPTLSLGLGLVAGVAWGLYSVLGRLRRQAVPSGALSLFLLTAGAVMAVIGVREWGRIDADLATVLVAVYMACLPTSLAYWLWDLAMKDGDVPALGAASNLIPILSASLAIALLGVGWRWELILGAGLVSLGAAVARWAFRERRASRGNVEST